MLTMKYLLLLCSVMAMCCCGVFSASTGTKKDAVDPTEPEQQQESEDTLVVQQYPFRDLPADVLRDFPGLCFGSTALRLFHVGQSWSLTPFCGVATCLVSADRRQLIERVQDCGPQPKNNPKCKNVNIDSEEAFPGCCPVFECEDGVELEYPTQEELQRLAFEAAQAAVRAQYEQTDEERPTAKVVANDQEKSVGEDEKTTLDKKEDEVKEEEA